MLESRSRRKLATTQGRQTQQKSDEEQFC